MRRRAMAQSLLECYFTVNAAEVVIAVPHTPEKMPRY